jgi:hypothetical protein
MAILEIHVSQALAANSLRSCSVQLARLLLQWIGGNSRTFRLPYASGLRICGHPRGFRDALTLMATAQATILGKVNIGFPSKGSGIRYRERP